MEDMQRIAALEAQLNDLTGRMIATEFALKMFIRQRLEWERLSRAWEIEKSKFVETMTECGLPQHTQVAMLDHLGRLSEAIRPASPG